MSTNLLILLSIVEAVVLIAVLAAALIEIRRRLVVISDGLSTLASALVTVETQHLRPLGGALTAINERAGTLLGLLPQIAGKAEVVVHQVTKGQ
ncbi:MAG TPA: hypothetical protein VG365_01655 [Solirubrobacteraceae bacterium]|jgi:hypothetical protein|nr:hypothetical protein [Solirubrobacteraceae bacterium]